MAPTLAEKEIRAVATAGDLPAFKVRGRWRTRCTELERWMDE